MTQSPTMRHASLLESCQHLCTRLLILPKLIYFTLNMTVYSTHTFTAIYFYHAWGLQLHQIGAVASLSAVQFLGALFWGHLADRTGRHKSILIMATIMYGVSFGLLNIDLFQSKAQLWPRITYTAAMYSLSAFFVSALFPLVDAQIFAILSRDPKFTKELFGRQRLWGTLGHGLVTLMSAGLIELRGFVGMFITLGVSCAAFLLCIAVGIPSDVRVEKSSGGGHGVDSAKEEREQQQQAPVHQNPAWALLLNGHFLFLMLVVLLAGYVRSVMSLFLGFYMHNEMDRSFWIIACVNLFRMLSEISIFFFNKQLLHTIGVHWMLIIAQLAGILRVLAYSYLPPKGSWFYFSFAIELLKGASTGFLVAAGVRLASDIAPKGCQNTAQAYFSGIYSGLSAALGGMLGGWIIYLLPDHSVAGMFRVTFFASAILLVLFVLKHVFIDRVILLPLRR